MLDVDVGLYNARTTSFLYCVQDTFVSQTFFGVTDAVLLVQVTGSSLGPGSTANLHRFRTLQTVDVGC